MPQKANIISNVVICSVLLVLSIFVFTADLGETYIDITAPLYSGNQNTKAVSFMFTIDDNSTADNIESIIASLQNARSGATFFVRGSWVAGNMDLTRKLAEEFELGNYGFTGIALNSNSTAEIKSELENCHNLVLSVASKSMKFFTPPEQKYNKTTVSVASGMGYTTVLPTQKTTESFRSGDLILMPVTTTTAGDIDRIISGILSQNFHIVSVGNNI
jgi:peptidoglycan/xylan/chitin deacetylase (PgdA/CDA1 family)